MLADFYSHQVRLTDVQANFPLTYHFLNRQVLRPGKLDFMLDIVSLGVGLLIFGNLHIRTTRSFFDIGGFL